MKKLFVFLLAGILLCLAFSGCADKETGDEVVPDVTDLEGYDAYGQEMNTDYRLFWKPSETDGYVGDPMPYYENGVYSIFYLKDEGGSLRHSVYRVDTTDFIHYTDKGEVLRSGFITQQDYWIGTGSVVKAENDYYFFYTGHNPNLEIWEKVMVAKSEGNMENFVKVAGFEISPPAEYSQVDFRDPQVYYDAERKVFDMTVETNAKGAPLIVKYTVSLDLQTVTHEGVIFTDTENGFWNLECADITEQNGKYFLTYSGQPEDTVWYAVSDEKFSGYGKPQRLEGKHFYAPKVVEGDKGTFLVGWVYRRAGFSDDSDLYWGGHLVAHKMQFNEDDSVTLLPVDGLDAYFGYENELLCAPSVRFSGKQRNKLANGAESYMITGSFVFEGSERFGFVLGYDDEYNRYLSYDPEKQTFAFSLRSNTVSECEIKTELEAGKKYDFVYIQEGSVGVFYILNECALSFRIHGINNKQIGIFSDGSTVSFENLSQYLRSKAVK